MSIFPNLDLSSYNGDDKDVLRKMETFFSAVVEANTSLQEAGSIDARFEAGDQSVFKEVYGNNVFSAGKDLSFNRIRRVINMISGAQRRNRKSIVVVPVEKGDQETADQFSKLVSWISRQENLLETISDAFQGTNISSLSLLQVWLDYREDQVSGNIKIDYCPFNSFFIDPYFKKMDLSDCNGIWKRTFLTKEEVTSLFPNKKHTFDSLDASKENVSSMDSKFTYMPENYASNKSNLFAYDEFYYRSFRSQSTYTNVSTSETQVVQTDDIEEINQVLKDNPEIQLSEQSIPTVRLAIVVDGKVCYDGPNLTGTDEYPFVPVVAYFNPANQSITDRFQSVVRSLRDPQYLYNMRRKIELSMLASRATTGYIVKEGTLVDDTSVYFTGEGRVQWVKSDAQLTDIQPIQSPDLPPNAMQLTEMLAREVQEISGVNEELLGSAKDDIPGILSMYRQGAGMTTLQILFDHLDLSMKILGKLLIKTIQNNFTPAKVARIIEGEPTQEFYNKKFEKYDAAVEEGLNTSTQKQQQFSQMVLLQQAGVPISPEDLIEASTLQNKKIIIDRMKQEQQQKQQAEQQAQQSQIALQQSNAKLADARAEADKGLAAERISRIAENRALAVERIAEANKDDEMAELNKVKAMKELEDMDINQVEKLLALVQVLKDSNVSDKENLQEQAQESEMQGLDLMGQQQPDQQQPEQGQEDMSQMSPPEQGDPSLE